MVQHWGRRGVHLTENEGVRSESKKFGENSRQMAPVSTICDEYCRRDEIMTGSDQGEFFGTVDGRYVFFVVYIK